MTSGTRARERKAAAKRHHVVPKAYLRAWADGHQRVLVVPKTGRKPFIAKLDNVAVQNKYYTLFLPDGSESTEIESAMSQIEGDAATALGALRGGTWPLSAEHRLSLARLIALQIGRAPQMRELVKQMTDRAIAIGKALQAGTEQLRQSDPGQYQWITEAEERLSRLHDRPSIPLSELEANQWTLPLQTLLATEELAEMVSNLTWTLLEANEGEFTTCDQPVVFWHLPNVPAGLLTAERTTVPIGRELCLELTTTPPSEPDASVRPTERQQRRQIDRDDVHLVNAWTTNAAQAAVIQHPAATYTDVAPASLKDAERIAQRVVGGSSPPD